MATTTRKAPFADELVYHILSFLSPREIIRIRPASKYFDGITRDRQLWVTLYANSCLPRPPGPFEWQSTRFLEHTLVDSERASQTWTSHPTLNTVAWILGPRFPSRRSSDIPSWHFLLGRLFVWCEEVEIFAQDFDTGARLLLWKNPTPIHSSSIEALTLNHRDGERVYIAFPDQMEGRSPYTLIKLLEFPVQRDASRLLGPVSFETNLPAGTSLSMNASFPFLYFDDSLERIFEQSLPLLVDTRTRAVYTFPPFKSSLGGLASQRPHSLAKNFIALSHTHILVTRELGLPNGGPKMTHIQAFVLPRHPSKTCVSKLRFSHETLIARIPPPTHVLRDSIIDPMTGAVHIRFLGFHCGLETSRVTRCSCIDVTLAPTKPKFTKILAIGVHEQQLFHFQGKERDLLLQSSERGHARGLVTSHTPDSFRVSPCFLHRFSIDASGERCTAVLSESEELRPNDPLKLAQRLAFDGARGRVCYDVQTKDVRYRDLVVADFR